MKTTYIGKHAESRVAEFLKNDGYKILNQNWRTKVCEIDVVTIKDEIVYFVEVKYRSNQSQGSGFEYITPKKLSQMEFAAQIWCTHNKWENDYRIMAASVDDKNIEIIEL
jgi:uncharacterized protein (TIGR00252 family)